MLERLMNDVEHFHNKMRVATKCDFPTTEMDVLASPVNNQLAFARLQMQTAALLCEEALKQENPDPRYLRLHLRLEETAEYIKAMTSGDAVEALDALADMSFVGAGDAVQFGWDLSEAQERICHSNDSKTPGNGPRLRDKGEKFVKPFLGDLI